MSSSEDSQLVAAAQAGDRPAFGKLYQRHAGMVHAILLAHAPRPDVNDLVQEVFLRALRELAGLRDVGAFGGWLANIARNRARQQGRRPPGEELFEEPVARETQHDELEAAAALAAIGDLPDAYRETLLMRLVEGMTGPEIAARSGLTEGSVRVNLHRGMKLLRERLAGRKP